MPKNLQYHQKSLSGKAGEIFKIMPPVSHKPKGEYKTELSEVYDWMREQEEVMSWLMNKANKAGLIKYDLVLEMWHGVDYFNEEENEQ